VNESGMDMFIHSLDKNAVLLRESCGTCPNLNRDKEGFDYR
jgi:hypothetical protein